MNSEFLETIRIVDGNISNLSYHQKRYESVLEYFGIKESQNLNDFILAPKEGVFRCRLVYSLDSIYVTYHEYKKREVKTLKFIYDDDINYSFKSTNRDSINSLFESRGECDDILIVKNSLITDTSIANVAFYDSDAWYTPKKPLLEGTSRARLIDEGKIMVSDIKMQDLEKFNKIAIFNAMIDFDNKTKIEISPDYSILNLKTSH